MSPPPHPGFGEPQMTAQRLGFPSICYDVFAKFLSRNCWEAFSPWRCREVSWAFAYVAECLPALWVRERVLGPHQVPLTKKLQSFQISPLGLDPEAQTQTQTCTQTKQPQHLYIGVNIGFTFWIHLWSQSSKMIPPTLESPKCAAGVQHALSSSRPVMIDPDWLEKHGGGQ